MKILSSWNGFQISWKIPFLVVDWLFRWRHTTNSRPPVLSQSLRAAAAAAPAPPPLAAATWFRSARFNVGLNGPEPNVPGPQLLTLVPWLNFSLLFFFLLLFLLNLKTILCLIRRRKRRWKGPRSKRAHQPKTKTKFSRVREWESACIVKLRKRPSGGRGRWVRKPCVMLVGSVTNPGGCSRSTARLQVRHLSLPCTQIHIRRLWRWELSVCRLRYWDQFRSQLDLNWSPTRTHYQNTSDVGWV